MINMYLISYVYVNEIQSNMVIMVNSNQPATFLTVMICLRIIWWFEDFFAHIQPWITFLVWNWCEVNICRKSSEFEIIIRFKFNINFVFWDWYDFFIPVAKSNFRSGSWVWTSQICNQFFISIRINFMYWYVIAIIIPI